MTATPSKLLIEHGRVPGGCIVHLNGTIDETFDKQRFISGVEGVVLVDLENVERITSYGVREWMSAVTHLRHSWLGFVNCHPAIVAQFNMVSGFGGRGHLLSLYLPYVCPTSGKAFEVLVDLRQHYADLAAFRTPRAQCPDSATEAEFDDIAEAYLSYVASQPAPEAPPLVNRLLGHAREPTGSLRVAKDVEGQVTGLWLSGRLDEKDHFRRLTDGLEGQLYVSCGNLSFSSEEGVLRLLKFFREVKLPLFLGELPLGLADRIADDEGLSSRANVCTLLLGAMCPEHGEHQQILPANKVIEAASGAPLLLFCPQCNRLSQPQIDPSALKNLKVLRGVQPPPGVSAVISTHNRRQTENTRMMHVMAEHTGEVVMQRYQIVRPLGSGGMAEVFLARQVGVGGFERAVVVKRILPNLASDEDFVEMFLQEARLASRLSHPNVVQILDVGRDGGQYFMVMELVSGWDLNTVLRASVKIGRPFPAQIAARITADVARALSAAHTHRDANDKPVPIIHRDVSPHNVLVSNQGHVKLTDFGIAKASDALTFTPSTTLKGKAAYMAPELIRSTKAPPDPRSDLFATGLLFYQLLTLVHPFRRDSELGTFEAVLHHEPPPPSSIVPGLPPGVDALVARMLAKNPDQRYQTALQLEHDLEKFVVASAGTVAALDVAEWISGVPELVPLKEPAEGGDTLTTARIRKE